MTYGNCLNGFSHDGDSKDDDSTSDITLKDIFTSITGLRGEVSTLKADVSMRFNKLEGNLTSLKDDVSTRFNKLEGNLTSLKDGLTTLRGYVSQRFSKVDGNLTALRKQVSNTDNTVSILLESVAGSQVRKSMGPDFSKQYTCEKLDDLTYFVRGLEQVLPTSRILSKQHVIDCWTGTLKEQLPEFYFDLVTLLSENDLNISSFGLLGQGYRDLTEDLTALRYNLTEIRSVLEKRGRKFRTELMIVDRLRWYADHKAAGDSVEALLCDRNGPGLAMFIWAVGKKCNESKPWFLPTLEFDMIGEVAVSSNNSDDMHVAVNSSNKTININVRCGEVKTTLDKRSKRNARLQLTKRLPVVKEVVNDFVRLSKIQMEGLCFYFKGQDAAVSGNQVATVGAEQLNLKYSKLQLRASADGFFTESVTDDDEDHQLDFGSSD